MLKKIANVAKCLHKHNDVECGYDEPTIWCSFSYTYLGNLLMG